MSYFLTNRIPTAAEAMRGFARGGEVEDERSYTPRGETLPVSPLATSAIEFMRGRLNEQPQAPSSPLADMAAVAPSMGDWTTLSEQATTEFINSLPPEDRYALLEADMAGLARGSPLKESPLALNFSGAGFGGTYSLSPQALFTEGTGGADLETGSLYSPLTSPSIERGKELQKQREAFVTSKAGEMPGAADLKKASEAMQAQAKSEIAAEEEKYLSTLPQRRELSNLLRQDKFSEAFKYAADNGITDLITNPAELKNLRGAFTKDELGKFFSSMPSDLKPLFAPPGLQDEKFNFDPQKGVEYSVGQWRGETGFPLVSSAFMAKKDRTVENLAKVAGAAMLTAGFAPALFGGAGAGGAGAAGTAGAGGTGALTSLKTAATKVLGIPETIGKTVATALNFNASPVAAKMIGNAVISGGVTGAKGGDLEDVLKSAAMAAGLTYVSDKAISAVAQKLQDSRILEAARDIPGGDITAAAADPTLASTIADNMSQGIREFTVSTFTPSAAAAGLQSVGAIGAAQQTIPGDRFAPEEDLLAGDITISTDGYDFGAGLETGAYTGYKLASDQGVGAEEPVATEEPVETVEVSAEGDELDLSDPLVQAVINQTPFEPEPIDPLTGQAEIEVTTAPEGLDITDPLTQVLLNRYIDQLPPEPPVDDLEEFEIETERDLSPGVLQYAPPVGPSVSPDEILPDYEPTQVKSKWEELLSKYGTAENFFRLAGALAGGAAGKTSTGAAPTVPQYDPRATAKAGPWIDWEKVKAEADAAGMNLNTYTARNWNKIQNRAFEAAGVGAGEDGGAPAPFNPNINVMGGAPTGMAEGGRYVDGPGSGRDDKIPALLSDGEYVIDAETLALLGDGSTKEGARLMDDFRSNIRKHKGAALAKGGISPHAKSPLQYLRGR